MAGVFGEPGLGGSDQARTLARAKGEGGFSQGWPGLYLDKGEEALAFRYQVNFAAFGAASLGEYHPAFGG